MYIRNHNTGRYGLRTKGGRCKKEQPNLIWGIREGFIHWEGQHFLARESSRILLIPPL